MRSPLLGYNHNLKYRGRVYHIQTEDSGETNPHIFTHLFHNGIIISTRKTEYGHLLGAEDVEDQVRKLMQLQHKDMMKGLLGGQFDDKIIRYFGSLNGEEEPEKSEKAEKAEKAEKPEKPSAPVESAPGLPPVPVPAARRAEKPTQSARPITASSFTQEETKLGLGQPGAVKTSTKPLREQSVTELGPPTIDYSDMPRTRPASGTDAGKDEPAPSVVIARPAIILTGDENTGFGSFAAPKSETRPSTGKSKKSVDPFEVPDTLLDITPVGRSQSDGRPARSEPSVMTRIASSTPPPVPTPPVPAPPAPTPPPVPTPPPAPPPQPQEGLPPPSDMRLTGPIQAPPGLFKPEASKEIPDDLVHLNTADTRVDDIILDFLMAESLAKLDGGDEKP